MWASSRACGHGDEGEGEGMRYGGKGEGMRTWRNGGEGEGMRVLE